MGSHLGQKGLQLKTEKGFKNREKSQIKNIERSLKQKGLKSKTENLGLQNREISPKQRND